VGDGLGTLYGDLIPGRSVGAGSLNGNLMPLTPAPGTPSVHPMPSPSGPLLALSFHTGGPRGGEGCRAPPYIPVQIFGGESAVGLEVSQGLTSG
jgi:hypothetical protein